MDWERERDGAGVGVNGVDMHVDAVVNTDTHLNCINVYLQPGLILKSVDDEVW